MLPAVILDEMIGRSPAIAALRDQVARLIERPAASGRLPPVLLLGETGTGKGLVARALHAASPRRGGPFVDVNCAAIPENLLEAEMFGVERGAFTGADRTRPGLFQAAHRGTLFLDEIGLVPEALQSKLLKAIEERVVRRLGRSAGEPVDVWIIAATSEDLEEAIRARRFRQDLYHRLAVMTLRVPPLHRRGADVMLLAQHFLARACADYGLPAKSFAEDVSRALRAQRWPGNVRELANVVERAALISEGDILSAAALGLDRRADATDSESPAGRDGEAPPDGLESTERDRVLDALEQTRWNLSRAAERLRIPRNTLRYRLERLGLRTPPPSRRQGSHPAPPSDAVGSDVTNRSWSPIGGGEHRQLTWLRADVVGPPPGASEFDASRALEMAADKVHAFGGEIELVHRMRVIAVFGLTPIEDATRRAALTALAIQKAAERAGRDETSPWSLKVGLHVHDGAVKTAGRAVTVEVVSKQAAEAALDALLDAAPPQSVLIDGTARAFLERRFDLTPGPVTPGAGGTVYRLSGPERAGFGLGGRTSAFVGRQQELALLESRLASVVSGRGHVVAIVGEAGIGKSRLLFELRQRLGAAQVTPLEGRCYSYAGAIPYFPVLDILRQMCGIAEADTSEATESKILLTLERLGVAAQEASPYLLQLFGPHRDLELRGVNPALLKARTFDAIWHMILGASRHRPCVVVLEDLHWIDRTSDELLALLMDGVPAAAILLVATYRPGYQPAWLARSYVSQVALAPLSREDSRAVLGSALGSAPVAPEVADAIVAKAEGNPFFLEELARSVGERAEAGATGVPDTIQSVLMARIDRLADDDRRLLQGAAVIGRDVPLVVLQATAGESEMVLRRRLTQLQAAEFIYQTRPAPSLEYTFKHALTHEVAYGSVAPGERRALHARVGQALLSLSPDTAERRPEMVARHLTAAELPDAAIPYWLRAGRNAIRRSAPVEAVSHLGTALDLLTRMPEGRLRDRQELELQLALGPALIMTKGYAAAEVEHLYARARALAQGLAEIPQLISASVGALGFHLVRGDQRAALESAEQLLAIALQAGSAALLVEAHFALGVSLHYRGRFDDARVHLEQSIGLYDQHRDVGHAVDYGQDPWIASLCYLAYGRALQGHEGDALRHVEAALRGADQRGHAFTRACALHFAGMIHELWGDVGAAREYAEREVAVAREHRFPLWLAGGTQLRGRLVALEGRLEEGLALMREGLAIWTATGAGLALPYYLSHLADAHLSAGNVAQGLAAVAEGLAVVERHDERNYAAELHRLQGALLASDPARSHEAEAAFERAVSLARQQRSRVLARRAAASFAAHLRGRGRAAEADRLLAELDGPSSPVS
jgi:DNA-binding NtrC family response regulator/predicted ATPase